MNDTNCTLLRWVEGEQKPFIPTIEDAAALGEMIGKLHRQSSNWQIPILFERPVFDGSRILQSLEKLKKQSNAGLLNAGDTELLQQACQRVITMMNTIERTAGYWGMIHADLIPSNHSLPDNYIELLEGFFIAGQLETMNFWLGLRGNLIGNKFNTYTKGAMPRIHRDTALFIS